MHEVAATLVLSSGRSCTLYRIRRDMIPDCYLLSFPRDEGEPSPADLSEMLVREPSELLEPDRFDTQPSMYI